MSVEVTIHNRQRVRAVSGTALQTLTRTLLQELLEVRTGELSVVLLGRQEMTRINETYLQHAGSTDVITFNYANDERSSAGVTDFLSGEILVCVEQAVIQARRFRTIWQAELARYVVHGVLHLLGHDDLHSGTRRRMKREENRLLKELIRFGSLRKLARAKPGR